jgi:hypothetical protein
MKKFIPTLLLIFLFLTSGVFAQNAKPTPPDDDGDVVKISTNLIQIDVSVTDKSGKIESPKISRFTKTAQSRTSPTFPLFLPVSARPRRLRRRTETAISFRACRPRRSDPSRSSARSRSSSTI